MGISSGISELIIATALSLAIVPYVIALKRTSALFSVLLGFIVLKEKNIKQTLIGTIIMFIGVLMISIS